MMTERCPCLYQRDLRDERRPAEKLEAAILQIWKELANQKKTNEWLNNDGALKRENDAACSAFENMKHYFEEVKWGKLWPKKVGLGTRLKWRQDNTFVSTGFQFFEYAPLSK